MKSNSWCCTCSGNATCISRNLPRTTENSEQVSRNWEIRDLMENIHRLYYTPKVVRKRELLITWGDTKTTWRILFCETSFTASPTPWAKQRCLPLSLSLSPATASTIIKSHSRTKPTHINRLNTHRGERSERRREERGGLCGWDDEASISIEEVFSSKMEKERKGLRFSSRWTCPFFFTYLPASLFFNAELQLLAPKCAWSNYKVAGSLFIGQIHNCVHFSMWVMK